MTISFPAWNPFDLSLLYPYQARAISTLPFKLKIFNDWPEPRCEVIQPVSFYSKRKGWESSYDPRHQVKGGEIKVTKARDLSSLPAKKFVVYEQDIKVPLTERRETRRAMFTWLRDQKIQFEVQLVEIKRVETEVFVFTKQSNAVLFKLTWA